MALKVLKKLVFLNFKIGFKKNVINNCLVIIKILIRNANYALKNILNVIIILKERKQLEKNVKGIKGIYLRIVNVIKVIMKIMIQD